MAMVTLADQISALVAARASAATRRRQARNTQRAEMTPRRAAGLAKRHAAKLARLAPDTEETTVDPHHSYLTEVRGFDHSALAAFPAYARLRQALSDLAGEVPEDSRIKLAEWLDAVRDMAVTAPYGDMCSHCSKECVRKHQHSTADLARCEMYGTYWPHAIERDGGWIKGTYRCPHGHTWTCGYAVNFMEYL